MQSFIFSGFLRSASELDLSRCGGIVQIQNKPFRITNTAYSENTGKVYGEANLGLFCGAQNRLRIRGKNLCVHGEDAKRHKIVYISVNNNNTNF